MPAPRYFGVGPYGVGYYSAYRGEVYDAAGRTGLVFGAQAAATMTINPEAVSGIVFSAWTAYAAYSWVVPPSYELGVWTPAVPCEPGVWALPPGCAQGSWQTPRFP